MRDPQSFPGGKGFRTLDLNTLVGEGGDRLLDRFLIALSELLRGLLLLHGCESPFRLTWVSRSFLPEEQPISSYHLKTYPRPTVDRGGVERRLTTRSRLRSVSASG